MRNYDGDELGIGLSANYASDVTLSGVNSENPPKLIVQPGRQVDLSYTLDGEACAGVEVTLEAVGATEYPTTKFTTDENGKLTLYLTEGVYKATTEKITGKYNASSNTFTVADGDVTESYALEKNNEETLPPKENQIEPGKYIKITYAKPKATNDGKNERSSANNDNNISIGSETIDLKNNCEFDTWYTTTAKLNEAVSSIDFSFGAWSAAAVSSIEVTDTADTMELTVQDNKTSMYITDQNQTLQYTANVYNSITTFADSDEVVLRGSVDDSAEVEYSANGYEGVEIDENGLLTITPQAQPGTVTVSASYGEITKTAQLELEEISDADGVVIAGDELVRKGGSYEFKALPTAGGTVIPERDTEWSIEGDARGCSIENGMLTVPQDAEPGNITIKAALTVSGSQTSENVFDTMTVTIKDDEALSPYSVNGVFLENCAADISQAAGYRGTQTEVSSDTVNKNMSEGINGYMSVGNIFVDFDMPQGA